MEECLPRPEDKQNITENIGTYATYWETLTDFSRDWGALVLAARNLIRALKLALCGQMCRIYDTNNIDEMRKFENMEKPLDLNLSPSAMVYIPSRKLGGMFHLNGKFPANEALD